jgi:hypothetical protein
LDDIKLDELIEAGKQSTLQLETALMISVRQDEEDILHGIEVILLEERIGDGGFGGVCEVVHDLQAN